MISGMEACMQVSRRKVDKEAEGEMMCGGGVTRVVSECENDKSMYVGWISTVFVFVEEE